MKRLRVESTGRPHRAQIHSAGVIVSTLVGVGRDCISRMYHRNVMHARNTKQGSYDEGANLTYELVGRFKAFAPLFAMPPKEIALLASLADVGKTLARNGAAHWLVDELLTECDRRRLSDYPTVMMLRITLEMHNIPIMVVPFAELGIKGKLMPMGRKPPV
jgi:hypothetical protein